MNDTKPGFIGKSIERKEDYRFLTGAGQYTDDVSMHGQTYAYFLRSPHAHAKIKSINTSAASKAPGVLGIFTGKDVASVGGLPCGWLITDVNGQPMKEPPHPGLSVRYDCLEPLGLTITAGAKVLGVSRQALNSLVNAKAGISPEMAIRLDKAFGGTAEAWLALQTAYDLAQAKKLAKNITVKRYVARQRQREPQPA